MKSYKPFISWCIECCAPCIKSSALCLVLLLAFAACSDDKFTVEPNPAVTEEESYLVSSFTLEARHFNVPDGTDSVDVALIGTDGVTHTFGAKVEGDNGALRYHLHVPASQKIADGRYVMMMRLPDGGALAGRLLVYFTEMQLSDVAIVLPTYDLAGSGTENDPYIIADSDDFDSFLFGLLDDEANAAGLYFRQTGEVVPSDASSQTAGRGYWGAPFAGDYDGGGNIIKGLYYHGNGRSESDTSFGLFTELQGYASVRDIKFEGVAVTGLYNDCGIVAGRSTGTHIISGISIAGSFEGVADSQNIGGIIGHVTKGSVTMTSIDLGADIAGGAMHTGGLVGCTDPGTHLKIDGVTTASKHFSVKGSKRVAGIAGAIFDGAEISNVTLLHDVTAEDNDIRIIAGDSEDIGGVIGCVYHPANSETLLTNIQVRCPVGGDMASNVGDIIGSLTTPAHDVVLNNCRMYSVVSGYHCVGGILGFVYTSSAKLRVEGEDFATRAAADNAAASVSGDTWVGGFAGSFQGNLQASARAMVNLTVKGTRGVGGALGRQLKSTVSSAAFKVGQEAVAGEDPVMKVIGTTAVGGVVGHLESSTLSGANAFDFAENGKSIAIPDVKRFAPDYSSVVQGTENVGGVVGYATESTVKAVSAACNVKGDENVGGVIGYFYEPGSSTVVEDCTFSGTLNTGNATYVGGVIGYYRSDEKGYVHDCVNYSSFSGGDNVGGVVGYVYKSRDKGNRYMVIQWCANVGDIDGGTVVGGIAGQLHSADSKKGFGGLENDERNIDLLSCVNLGDITAQGGNDGKSGVGGVVGFTNNRIRVANSANHGDIYSHGKIHGVGGVAGSMGEDPTGLGIVNEFLNAKIESCCNTGDIDTGDGNCKVGGVLGYLEEGSNSHFKNCYNRGHIKADTHLDTGGLVGYVDSNASAYGGVNYGMVDHGNACPGSHSGINDDLGGFWYKEGTGKGWKATAVSASHMTNKSYFGLDFDSIWDMGSDGPVLRSCPWQYYTK